MHFAVEGREKVDFDGPIVDRGNDHEKLRVNLQGTKTQRSISCAGNDRREKIFKDDTDRERFLATLDEACARTGWLHASLDFKLQIADRRFAVAAL